MALLAALAYGISDFVGGLSARRVKAITVLTYSYPVGALLMIALLPFFPGPISVPTLLWGVAGGVCGFVGVLLMYTALALAPMNVISPVTAVCTAVVPIIAGVVAGERPSVLAWSGIALGLAAVMLISRSPDPLDPLDRLDDPETGREASSSQPAGAAAARHSASTKAIVLALVAGIGFGGYFICLSRADTDSGLWPVVLARVSSSLLAFPVALRMGAMTRLRGSILGLAAIAGTLDAGANLFFLLAARDGYLSLASVITALYPAGTVALAMIVLKERTSWAQRGGFAIAGAAVLLLTR
jgi:drug/metabolite transporter (DMT)-like permease